MPLTLTLKTTSSIPLELDGLCVEALRTLADDEVRCLPIPRGNEQRPLGDYFDVTGCAADGQLIVRGDCRCVKGLGTDHSSGVIRVEGSIGLHVGARQSGGEIHVEGSVGDWAGAEMRGGLLTITGSAANGLGGAYHGARKGMTGGEIVVHGDCGDEAGAYLRRGTIAVAGRGGTSIGHGMIAGTIVLGNGCGRWPGAGMKRGTILIHGSHAGLLPSFREAAILDSPFTALLWRRLTALGFPSPQNGPYRRYCGDLVSLGKGEILLPV